MNITNLLIALAVVAVIAAIVACSPTKLVNAVSHDFGSCREKDVLFDEQHQLAADFYYTNNSSMCASLKKKNHKPLEEHFEENTIPTIIFIYGGSWDSGDKSDYSFVADFFTENGFNVVIPNYRLYPDVGYPQFIDDLESFVGWFSTNAQLRGVNKRQVHIVGHSAGAFNSAMYLFGSKYNKPFTFTSFIGLAGPYDFFLPAEPDKEYRNIFTKNGSQYNRRNSLPAEKLPKDNLSDSLQNALILHGKKDSVVTPKNAENLSLLLNKSGVRSDFKIYPDADHVGLVSGLSKLPILRSSVGEDVLLFLKKISL